MGDELLLGADDEGEAGDNGVKHVLLVGDGTWGEQLLPEGKTAVTEGWVLNISGTSKSDAFC